MNYGLIRPKVWNLTIPHCDLDFDFLPSRSDLSKQFPEFAIFRKFKRASYDALAIDGFLSSLIDPKWSSNIDRRS